MNRRQNGHDSFKNPNDIHDSTTKEEIEREVDQEVLMKQATFEFDVEDLDANKARLLESLEADILRILEEWNVAVGDLLERESRISPRMRDFIEKSNLDLPTFTVQLKERSDEFLKEVSIDAEIDDGSFLVTFNLPKPMGQFWWKGGAHEWGQAAKDVREMVIEWGRMYRRLIPIVWSATDNADVYYQRINPIGMHDPKKYYYIWEMSDEPADSYDADW
ncbi:hypothetical protein HN358_01285 [Candidatus Uhrbacteria bacterium]|jgi:hypothetical protein|nr:hypothetical protein [Candidatus Uhrbacteria bacterium]MBT7717335.1 hypothetical protein [Candidatus Uhrbacteria bacterium]